MALAQLERRRRRTVLRVSLTVLASLTVTFKTRSQVASELGLEQVLKTMTKFIELEVRRLASDSEIV